MHSATGRANVIDSFDTQWHSCDIAVDKAVLALHRLPQRSVDLPAERNVTLAHCESICRCRCVEYLSESLTGCSLQP